MGTKMSASLEEEIIAEAIEFIDAFRGEGSPIDADKLDYSEQSLALLDEVLEDFYEQDEPLPEDLYFLSSAYMFEVIRREFGGRYIEGDEDNPVVLVIGEPKCQINLMVMAKVEGRVLNGPEDSLTFFYASIRPVLDRGVSTTLN